MSHTNYRYFALGRHAMQVALQLAGVSPGDAVMLPGFICRDLISSIVTLGARPSFYDVDRNLDPLTLDRTVRPRAIIAVNYFGFPQKLEPFERFRADTGAVIIEDNAHGFLSRDLDGRELGQRTTLGITSFRKTLYVVDGATLAMNDSQDLTGIPDQIAFRSSSHEFRVAAVRSLTAIERKTGIPTLHLAQSISHLVRFVRTGSTLPVSDPSVESEIPGVANPHETSIERMLSVDTRSEINRRRTLYERLLPEVINLGAQPIFATLPIGVSPYGLAFYASPTIRRGLAKLSRRYHVTLMTWPDLPQEVQPSAPAHYREVWLLNFR